MPLHILIVDADPDAGQVTRGLVQRIEPSATIVYERTPGAACAAAQQTSPDVLIIDPAPLGIAGVLTIQQCVEQHPDVRVIVLGARLPPATRRSIQSIAAYVYLEKPAASATLVEQIRRGLPPQPSTALVNVP